MTAELQSDTVPSLPDSGEMQRLAQETLATVKAAREKLHEDAETLRAQRGQIERERVEFAEAHSAADQLLAERERSLEQMEQRFNEQLAELEPQRERLDRRERDMMAREEQIETFAAELNDTHRALSTLQQQLARDQQDLAAQRQELLDQLGGVKEVPIGTTGRIGDPASSAPPPTPAPPPSPAAPGAPKPKPAASAAAGQFRKLRRDAKRKAIGV